MTLLQAGRDGLSATISRHNHLARHLAGLINTAPDLELLAPPVLSIVCFRFVPPDWSGDDAGLNALNKAIMEVVQAGGEAFVTQAVLGGRFYLRANVLHYATTEDDMEALVGIISRVGEQLAA